MAQIETEVRVVRKVGRIAELHVAAKEETREAGYICHWMPKSILLKTTSADLTDGKLTLTCPRIGSLSFAGSEDDLRDILEILTATGNYQAAQIRLCRCTNLSGFKIFVFAQ